MFDREKVIDVLIEDDIYSCEQDVGYLYDLLSGGFKGYISYSDEELIEECNERDISYLIGDNDD